METNHTDTLTNVGGDFIGSIIDMAVGLLPVVVPLIGVFFGIKYLPKLIKKFAK